MQINIIIDRLLDETGSLVTDKIGSILLTDIFYALITTTSMVEASISLGITDNALEHLLRRKVLPLFPTKTSNVKWCNYLLDLLDLKKCFKCGLVGCYTLFSKHSTAYRCKTCDSKKSVLWQSEHREVGRARSKKHYLNNKHYYLLKSSHRRRLLYRNMPAWADLSSIKNIYNQCPDGFHVDHIIPLQGLLVSGLHVENNLQYLSAKDNLHKSNKFNVE